MTGTSVNLAFSKIAVQSDNKMIVYGTVTTYNSTAVARIVRVDTNGSIDTTFVTGAGFNNTVNKAVIQSDGKVVVVGDFTTYK